MPYITALKRLKYHKDRLNLFIEKEFVCTVPDYIVDEYKLKHGVDVPQDVLDTIIAESNKFQAAESAYRYLTNRPHSVLEIRQKLMKKGFDKSVIKGVIDKCMKNGYLDDEKFARAWIKSRLSSKPRGRKMLQAELYKKGIVREIADSVIDAALNEIPEDKLALQLLHKNCGKLLRQNSVDLKHKIYNFLSYRGFGYQAIKTASDIFITEFEIEDEI
jgi:regulatory protein